MRRCGGTLAGLINHAVDFAPDKRGGAEVYAAVEICRRAKAAGIKIDIMTYDGMGYNRDFFEQLKDLDVYYFTKLRKDDKRKLQVIDFFESAIKLRKARGMTTPTFECVHDEIKFTVTSILEEDPVTGEPIRIAKIESEPIGAKLRRLKAKEAARGKQDVQYDWEKDNVWEKLSERKMTHYVVTNAVFLTCRDVLSISISHWTVETHWRKVKRAFWSRNSYKRNAEHVVVLFIGVSMGISITELVKHEARLVPHFQESAGLGKETDELLAELAFGTDALRERKHEEKQWTLKRVRTYINEAARSRHFRVK